MKFLAPQWLWVLLALPPALWLALRDERKRQDEFARFAARPVWRALVPELDPKARARKAALWCAVAGFTLLALARPQWGTHEESTKTTGLDVMVTLDVSTSMETEDVVPSRLRKARHLVKTLADRIRGDRVGLVGFAASSYVACPLTTDTDYFLEILGILGPRMVTNQGTDIGIGLETARKALERGAEESGKPVPDAPAGPQASRVIVLISDGEDQEEGALQAARALKEAGIKLYVLGVGTERGGPIAIRDESGNLLGNKKDRKGQLVVSAFKPAALQGVAQAAGGRYWNMSPGEGEVDEILRDMGALNRTEYAERKYLVYEDRFQWPLAVAVLLLLIEVSMPVRRIRRERAGRAAAVGVAALAGAAASLLAPAAAQAAPLGAYLENEKGLKSFQDGKLSEAQREFGTAQALDPGLPELQYNQGTVQLGQGDPEAAARAFEESAQGAARAGDDGLEAKSLFNLGIALDKKKDLKGAIQSYIGAVDAARRAGDGKLEQDARKNLELLVRKREQQKQRQKQDSERKKDGEQNPDQNQDPNQEPKSGEQPGDQKEPQDGKDEKDKKGEKGKQGQDQPKQYQDPSKTRKKSFQSKQLTPEDAERVMSELSGRERDLQARVKKQNGNPQSQNNAKDW